MSKLPGEAHALNVQRRSPKCWKFQHFWGLQIAHHRRWPHVESQSNPDVISVLVTVAMEMGTEHNRASETTKLG